MAKVMATLDHFNQLILAEPPGQEQTTILQRISSIKDIYYATVSYFNDPQGLRKFYFRDVREVAEQLKLL